MLNKIMKGLIEGLCITLETKDGFVVKELFLDDEGTFRVNELKYPNTKELYDQYSVTDIEVIELIKRSILNA